VFKFSSPTYVNHPACVVKKLGLALGARYSTKVSVISEHHSRIGAFPAERAFIILANSHICIVKLSIFTQIAVVTNSRFCLFRLHWSPEVMDYSNAVDCWDTHVVYLNKRRTAYERRK
jgi:hypothetical protein